uniref:Pentatricopeptide repeat-containing protein At2g32630 family n=1 Tax=Cajanus cajan TaxID=3821 RepID=A0A151U2Q2_CAJCA|nr:Pentatricopeptide repeat-containing protein At2g32630 family [Cajanus cajan]
MCSHSLKRILAKFPPTPQHLKLAHTITLNLLNSTTTTIPCLAPHVAYRVLSHPSLPPRSCLAFFHLLNPNPDLTAHLILLFRLFQAQNFASFKSTLNSLLTQAQIKHPVSSLISLLDHYQFQSHPNFLRTLCDILFRLCADNGMFQDAFNVFDYGTAKASLIEPRSCFVLLLAFKKRAHFHLCEPFFRRMVDSARVDIGVQSLTLVVDVLCRNGDVERAKALIHEMAARGVVTPNVFTYNTLLNACVARKDRNGVGEVLALMEREGVVLSLASYTILIQWHAGCGRIREAEKLFDEMRERNVEMDVYVYTSMISWNCREGNVRRALALFDEMISRGVAPNARTFGALISGVCKAGEMEAAQILLEEMQMALNVVTCTLFIEIYCKEGSLAEAERFLRNMEKKGVVPNVVTYNTLIDAFSKKEKVKRAHMLKAEMIEKGLLPDVFTYTSLIHGECIVGRVDEALKIFNEMLVKGISGNVKTYTAIISGLSKEGRADEAFKFYDEMTRMGLTPDDRVFAALVGSLHKSSSHAGAEQNEFGELKTDTSDTSSWSNTGLSSSHRKAART